MSQHRTNLERQITHAKEALALWIQTLDSKGVSVEKRPLDAKWRELRANRLALEARLRRVAKSEALVIELVKHKAEKAAAPAQKPEKEKPEKTKKPKAEKKDAAPAKAEKASGGGDKGKGKQKGKSKGDKSK